MVPVRRWVFWPIGKGRNPFIGRTACLPGQNVVGKDQYFRIWAAMVLSAQIDFEWMKCSANRCDPLWSNARQVIEDLLFEVSEANDLRVWSKHFNALPRELPGVLGLVNDDDGMPSRERRKQMAASGEQTSGVGERTGRTRCGPLRGTAARAQSAIDPIRRPRRRCPVQSLLILRQQIDSLRGAPSRYACALRMSQKKEWKV